MYLDIEDIRAYLSGSGHYSKCSPFYIMQKIRTRPMEAEGTPKDVMWTYLMTQLQSTPTPIHMCYELPYTDRYWDQMIPALDAVWHWLESYPSRTGVYLSSVVREMEFAINAIYTQFDAIPKALKLHILEEWVHVATSENLRTCLCLLLNGGRYSGTYSMAAYDEANGPWRMVLTNTEAKSLVESVCTALHNHESMWGDRRDTFEAEEEIEKIYAYAHKTMNEYLYEGKGRTDGIK